MPQKITELQNQLEKIIKGKKDITDKILMAVIAKGHVLLEDVPGVGKTTTALALSRLMGMEFNRIQFTPDVVPSDVTGFTMYDKQSGQFSYRAGAVMCNLLLADEINRTSSKTQSALLEVMEEAQTYAFPTESKTGRLRQRYFLPGRFPMSVLEFPSAQKAAGSNRTPDRNPPASVQVFLQDMAPHYYIKIFFRDIL